MFLFDLSIFDGELSSNVSDLFPFYSEIWPSVISSCFIIDSFYVLLIYNDTPEFLIY